jgi:hypothetical protein
MWGGTMKILSKMLRWVAYLGFEDGQEDKTKTILKDLQDTLTAEEVINPEIKPELFYEDPIDTEAVAEVDSTELLAVFQYIKKQLPHIDPRDLHHHVTIIGTNRVRAVWAARTKDGHKYIGLISACLRKFVEWKGATSLRLFENK